jgi:hypothetical protein
MRRPTLSDILRDMHVAPEMQDRLARTVYNLGGGRMPMVFSAVSAGNALNAAESVVVTSPPLNPGLDSALVLLIFEWSTGTIGTTGTAVTMIIRQGTTALGPNVGLNPTTLCTAGQPFNGVMVAVDTPGAVAGQQYTGTITVTGAGTNSATVKTFLLAMAIG